MVLQIGPVTESDDLSLLPVFHIVEEENRFSKVDL